MNSRIMLDDRSIIEPTRQLPTLPDRPEPTAEERAAAQRADRIGNQAVLKLFGWSDSDFVFAEGLGFPKSVGRKLPVLFSWGAARRNFPAK
jgi:hypothetical protein